MSKEWTDEEFLRYVELHCTTERAGFVAAHVLRLYELAGERKPFHSASSGAIFNMHEEQALPLVQKARERLKEKTSG